MTKEELEAKVKEIEKNHDELVEHYKALQFFIRMVIVQQGKEFTEIFIANLDRIQTDSEVFEFTIKDTRGKLIDAIRTWLGEKYEG